MAEAYEQQALDLFGYDDLLGDQAEQEELRTDVEPPIGEDAVVAAAVRYYRDTGFPYRALPRHMVMQELNRLARTQEERLVNTNTGYAAADTYHPHRWRASAAGMRSPWQSFQDDKALDKALRLDLLNDQVIGIGVSHHLKMVNGTQMCSNFRPGFACHLYRRFARPGATVLDTSTGYGGRLFGFLASGIAQAGGRYIGVDPARETHLGNMRMAYDLGFASQVELINLPAEDVPYSMVLHDGNRSKPRCDFAFTSPPYFTKERYTDEDTQSWVRYGHSVEAWVEGFLKPMFDLQYAALKPGSTNIVNIEDVLVGGNRKERVPLVRYATECAVRAGFEYVVEERFGLQRRFGKGFNDQEENPIAGERVLVFRKDG